MCRMTALTCNDREMCEGCGGVKNDPQLVKCSPILNMCSQCE